MTHRSASKMDESSKTSTRYNNGARRDSMAQSEGGVPKKAGSSRTDNASFTDVLYRGNSVARRDSVTHIRGSVNRRNSNTLMETNDDGRESVTQDSGMTDLTEATHYEQGKG